MPRPKPFAKEINDMNKADSVIDVTSTAEERPLPVNIPALIEKIQAYRRDVAEPVKNGEEIDLPAVEPFTDCILAILNLQAERNGGEKFNGRQFDSPKDFLQYLHQTHHDNHEPSRWRAIVPGSTGEHVLGYEVRREGGRNLVVGFESSTLGFGRTAFRQIIGNAEQLPGAIHNTAMVVSGVQKSRRGCGMHSVTTLRQTANEPGATNGLFAELLSKKIEQPIYKDSHANILPRAAYWNAQSGSQLLGIQDNPKWYGRDESDIAGLLSRNIQHRVTRVVSDVETNTTRTKTFSNAVDDDRLILLGCVIEELQTLQRENPQQAGQIFADLLAEVRISRPRGWDRTLSVARQAVELQGDVWEANNEIWREDHSCWTDLPVQMQGKAIAEVIEAVSQWQRPSSLRINILDRIARRAEILGEAENSIESGDSQTSTFNAQEALGNIPEVTKQLAPTISEEDELRSLLTLNRELLRSLPDVERLDGIRRLAEIVPLLRTNELRTEIGKEIIFLIDAWFDNDLINENPRWVTDVVGILVKYAPENIRLRSCQMGYWVEEVMQMENEITQGKLLSLFELSVNLDSDSFGALLQALAGEPVQSSLLNVLNVVDISYENISEIAEEFREKNQAWVSLDDMADIASHDAEDREIELDSQELIDFDEIDLDRFHPLQRLKGMQRYWIQLWPQLPSDLQAKWANPKSQLDVQLSQFTEQITNRRLKDGTEISEDEMDVMQKIWEIQVVRDDDLLNDIDQWELQNSLSKESEATIGNVVIRHLQDHSKYMDALEDRLFEQKERIQALPSDKVQEEESIQWIEKLENAIEGVREYDEWRQALILDLSNKGLSFLDQGKLIINETLMYQEVVNEALREVENEYALRLLPAKDHVILNDENVSAREHGAEDNSSAQIVSASDDEREALPEDVQERLTTLEGFLEEQRTQLDKLTALRAIGDPSVLELETEIQNIQRSLQNLKEGFARPTGERDSTRGVPGIILIDAINGLQPLHDQKKQLEIRMQQVMIREEAAKARLSSFDLTDLRPARYPDRVLKPVLELPDQQMVVFLRNPGLSTTRAAADDTARYIAVSKQQLQSAGRNYEHVVSLIGSRHQYAAFQVRLPKQHQVHDSENQERNVSSDGQHRARSASPGQRIAGR